MHLQWLRFPLAIAGDGVLNLLDLNPLLEREEGEGAARGDKAVRVGLSLPLSTDCAISHSSIKVYMS